MNNSFQKIQTTSLREQIINSIRNAMVEGKFKPGEKISENELAEQLGVSRTPVREAIRILEQQGLVKTVPKSGTYVAEVDPEEIIDRLNVRIAVEELALRKAIECSSIEQWQQLCKDLRKLLGKMETAIRNEDRVRSIELDIEWHTRLIDTAQNRYLSWLWRTSGMQYLIWSAERGIYPVERELWVESTVNRHKELLDVLLRKNADECCQAIREHIEVKLKDLKI